jgi:polyisoprenoid-binding protein YceI
LDSWPGPARSFALAGLALSCALAGAAGAVADEDTERFLVDPARSHVRIELDRSGLMKFLGHDHQIEAPIAEGRLDLPGGEPGRASLSLRFDAARLFVIPGSEPADDIPKVEERMRGPEVLEVAKYPQVVFASGSVKSEPQGPSGYRIVLSGTLTLKGRAFPVALPLEAHRVDDGIEAQGEAFLNLRDLGIEPPSVAGVVKVANRFRLVFKVHARPSAAPR